MSNVESQLKSLLPNIPIERVSQGAEALIYRTTVHPYLQDIYNSDSCQTFQKPSSYIIKYRPPKTYRHPELDATLTKHRTLSETRLLQKLSIAGINVPSIIYVDFRQGIIWMEDIIGKSNENAECTDIKEEMRGSLKNWIWDIEKEFNENSITENTDDGNLKQTILRVGKEIGKLHLVDIVHGDLTTSNILLRPRSPENIENKLPIEPVIIDFGLGSYSTLAEDKAVDLYVLERAVESTHPVNSELYKAWLLEGYSELFNSEKKVSGPKKLQEIMKKLQDVRLRGRKRSMLG